MHQERRHFMTDQQESQSEVARLLAQFQAEYEAAQRGLSGLASGASQHRFIQQKMERMGELQTRLQDMIGETAIAMIAEALECCPDQARPKNALLG
jgi:hypothetical protein